MKKLLYGLTSIAIFSMVSVIPAYAITRSAEITSPTADSIVTDTLELRAYLIDDDYDPVQWAVRRGTCAAATNTMIGNVDGKNTPFVWDVDSGDPNKYLFSSDYDISSWVEDTYCFIFNPSEDGGEADIRLTEFFKVNWDEDNDGVYDDTDNCLGVVNPDQNNIDGDAYGDACDTDDDGDGVLDNIDNCIDVVNPGQEDADSDGPGDACDTDDDNDGVLDTADNCHFVSNPGQANFDGDAYGDACDTDDDNDGVLDGDEEEGCTLDTDCDNDGVLDDKDFCDVDTIDDAEWINQTGEVGWLLPWGTNRWQVQEDNFWYQNKPAKKGVPSVPLKGEDINYTYGCNGHQILEMIAPDGESMKGHWKFGLSSSVLDEFHWDMADGILDGKYLLDTVIVDSVSQTGATSSETLVSGKNYTFDVSGTWQNRGWEKVDAKYTTGDNWATYTDAPSGGYLNELLDLQVNNTFVDWGSYSTSHLYTRSFPGNDSTVNFRVFDGDVSSGTPTPSWYGDNIGSLSVNIYLDF